MAVREKKTLSQFSLTLGPPSAPRPVGSGVPKKGPVRDLFAEFGPIQATKVCPGHLLNASGSFFLKRENAAFFLVYIGSGLVRGGLRGGVGCEMRPTQFQFLQTFASQLLFLPEVGGYIGLFLLISKNTLANHQISHSIFCPRPDPHSLRNTRVTLILSKTNEYYAFLVHNHTQSTTTIVD